MFSQVSNTYAIIKHVIYLETIVDFVTLAFLLGQEFFLREEALD
jgi:hypothetical protein